MARITVKFEGDGEAVWFWELCKKLGAEVLEVRFSGVGDDATAMGNADDKRCAKCAVLEADGADVQEDRRAAEKREPSGGRKSSGTERHLKNYTRKL